MKNKMFTWIVKNEKGEAVKKLTLKGELKDALYYGKLEEVIQYLSLKEYLEMATLEIINNAYDKTNHRPITKEQIVKMLKEMN